MARVLPRDELAYFLLEQNLNRTLHSVTVSVSSSDLSDELKSEFAKKITATGQNVNVAVLKFFVTSLEYQRIHNFPQHGLQFVAEV